MADDILSELRETNRLIRKLLNHEVQAHEDWKEHVKIHEKMMVVGEEMEKTGKEMMGFLEPKEMMEMMKTAAEAMKYTTKELKDKAEDDADFKRKLKGFKNLEP